jgi:DNA-binding CsgD family transcriptional regulator
MKAEKVAKLEAQFVELASHGLNCKEIANIMGISTKAFGAKMCRILGVYPSIYIARMKNGKA